MNEPRPRIVLYFISRYKLHFVAVILLTLVVSILESLSIGAFFPVFAALIGHSEEQAGGFSGTITRVVSILPFTEPIVSASVFLLGVFLFKTAVTLTRERVVAFAGARIFYDVKRQIMERYGASHYQFFLDNSQGRLIYVGLSAPIGVANLMLTGAELLGYLLKIVAISVVLGIIFPVAALALAALGLGYYAVMHQISRRISYPLGRERTNTGAQLHIIQNEFLSGIHQMITLRAVRHWKERFDRENHKYSEIHARTLTWFAVPRPIMELLVVALMVVFVVVLWFTSPANFTEVLPRLGIFGVAMVQLLPAVTGFGRGRMAMMSHLPDMELVYDTIVAPLPSRGNGFRDLKSFEHALSFEKVSFAHKGRDPLLVEVDLNVEKGKVTAIVGPSGAGKTTIINLILGLFDPTSGRITVDGIPLQEFKSEAWLGHVGFVSQEPFTYHSTVAENILFGRNGHSMESIINSAQTANAHGFISDLPQGYETVVGERGMKLSGGQQQRITIARAVLDNPEILIFDEATSSLDTVSERLVQDAISNVSANRTVIIVAHRLSTIRHADKIIVLDKGRVVEEGTHHELLSRNGVYAHMVSLNS